MAKLLKEFKDFLITGNLVVLAVAFVMAAALGALVTALVKDIVTPIIAMIFGQPDFGGLSFTINSSHFFYGDFLNALIAFVGIAAAVFFFIVKPYNMIMARRARGEEPAPAAPTDVELLTQIRDLLAARR